MAKTFQTDVILKLVDHLAGPLVRTARGVERSTSMIRRSFKALDRQGARLALGFAGAAGLTRATEALGRQMVEISKLQNKINAASVNIEEGANGPIARMLDPLQKAANLDSAIRNSQKYGVAVQSFLKAQDELIRAGNTPEAARAASGLSTILGKFSGMDAGKVAEQLTSVMVDFKLPRGTAEQIEATTKEIGNLLAFAETAAPGKIADIFESLRFSGSILAGTGTDLKQTTAILIGLAKANVKGSEAGVALRSMIVSLVRPTRKGRIALEELGLSYDDFVTKIQASGKTLGDAMSKYSQGDSLDPVFQNFDPKAHEKALDKIAKIKDLTQKQAALTDFIKKNLPAATGMEPDALATIVNENLAAAGTKVDLTKFFTTALEKGIPAEALVRIFEGRQFNRINLAIQHAMETVAMGKKGIPGNLLETMFGETQKGLSGAVDRLESSFSRLAAVLERSQIGKDIEIVLRGLAGAIDALSTSLDKLDPNTQRFVAISAGILMLVGLSAPILALGRAFFRLARGMAAVSAATAALPGAGAAAGATAAAAGAAAGAGGLARITSGIARVGMKSIAALALAGLAVDAYKASFAWEGAEKPNDGAKGKSAQEYIAMRRGKASKDAAGAIDEESRATVDLTNKGAMVQTFSSTVATAMEKIQSSVGSAAQGFSDLIGKINGAAGAVDGLNGKASMGADVLKRVKSGVPMGTGSDKSSSLGGSSSGKLAIDITSSDSSVKVKGVKPSGTAPSRTQVSYLGRRMADIG